MRKLIGYSVLLHFYMKCIIIYWSSMTFASNIQAADTCRSSDIETLMSLKNGFQDPDTSRLSSWKGSNCCEWPGIRCDNISLSIIAVDISGYALSGSISASLTKLNKSLTYLDLSLNYFYDSPIPEFFCSLSKLRYLNLSRSWFGGMVTTQLGNLSNLEYLDLTTSYSRSMAIGSLEWLAGFASLKHLAFDNINMSTIGSKWLETLTKLPSLKELHMSNCGLTGSLSSISTVNFTSLSWIDLSNNQTEGGIQRSIGKLCNLRVFDVTRNNLTETLPKYLSGGKGCRLGNPLPNLTYLHLDNNKLNGNLPAWLGLLRNLKELRLSGNSFHGPIPSSLGALNGLETLDLSENNLNGTVPTTIGQLSELSSINLRSNQLSGMITEAHFTRMAKLTLLALSSNSLTFRVGSNWVPPFQLQYLSVRTCKLGTTFPTWLKSQKQLSKLDLSNNNISGYVPSWFWDDVAPNLSYLNISFNHLQGILPNPFPSFGSFEEIILSYNRFTGSIPPNIGENQTSMILLSMSNNLLTGEIPTSIGLMSQLMVLDLSNNNLSGNIPSNLELISLVVLDISNNILSGSIPSAIWHLKSLTWVHMNNNQLSRLIPPTIQSMYNIDTLDLSHNVLSGTIPSWIGQCFPNLRVINLRSNHFHGEIPPTMSKLYSLQVLDLAENKLTGNITSSRVNLTGLHYPPIFGIPYLSEGYRAHQESLTMNVKYNILKYTKASNVPSNIDLSCNRFSGPFPAGITNLSHLQLLNLSRNEISGRIPDSISKMRALESLDFSNNKLSGPIPLSITSLTLLEVFDASNNNLSGTIPFSGQFSTFSSSAFEGNSGLCGLQLNITCSSTKNRGPATKPSNNNKELGDEIGFVYMSIGVGFVVGLLFPILLAAANETWRLQYFKFVDLLVNCCCGV